jgi:putative transposase
MMKISYAGYRFPPEIIHRAIWLYLRFTLSFRDVEDLLAERGIAVSYETVRRWVNHFGRHCHGTDCLLALWMRGSG